MPDPDLWPELLLRLSRREDLGTEDAADAMRQIMAGEATPAQIGAFLLALRTKGETVDEIDGLARTMLEFATPVKAPEPVIDTCGTGGDRSGTFNISTVSALVVAGAGVPVAKHGNRAASSHCGSADLLESLGVRIDRDPVGLRREGWLAPRATPGPEERRPGARTAERPEGWGSGRVRGPRTPDPQRRDGAAPRRGAA